MPYILMLRCNARYTRVLGPHNPGKPLLVAPPVKLRATLLDKQLTKGPGTMAHLPKLEFFQ
jgi:hypothetical protein